MFQRIGRVGAAVVMAACVASAAFAQGGNALINGTVFDQAKAVLPGVTVTVTNEATGITRDTVTTAEGIFTIPTLSPGTYTVRAELQGFQPQSRQGLVLRIGQELTLDLTLGLAGVAENVTVTAEAPIVEVTASRLGAVVSDQEIDSLPSQGRNHLSLMQLVPGLVPELTPGEFEGGNFNVNGRGTASNLWTVDGAANQDTDGGGTGPQARITLDSMAEFQVLTHQYTAEFGGSSGVIVNAVTKSGTNMFNGRGFYYLEDDKLRALDPFLKEEGVTENPDSGRNTFGFNIGGPIVRNKAFFFFNAERNLLESAVVHTMPPEAAPLAVNYADASIVKALSTFARVDYTAGQQNFGFRWQREVAPAVGEDFECCQTLENRQIELDSNDRLINLSWTGVFGSRMTNELRVSHAGEDRVDGNLAYMNVDPAAFKSSGWIDDLKYVGLNGRDQFDIGSRNAHADFDAGMAAAHGGADSRNYTIQNATTLVSGAHTFKGGFMWNRPMVSPQRIGANDNGTFTFRHNLPFNPANALTYPSRFSIVLGDIIIDSTDDWYNGFFQDQWRATNRLTLNLGVRYDYQTMTPQSKDAFAPRLGFAYDLKGDGRTAIRGGFGKFYEYHLVGTAINLARRGVFGQTFTFDTGEDTSADRGVIPASHPCLSSPIGAGGLAAIGPACRAFLTTLRSSLQPGAGAQFINTEPQIDGNRHMGYLLGYSFGVQHELMRNLGVGVDFVGNQGKDQTRQIDINEGPTVNGRITRLGAAGFDPSGALIPASARAANFQRVLQYQTRSDFDSDFKSLEVSMDKRYSNKWSGRVAYTLAYSNDVPARVVDDRDPRSDYGRSNTDNRHAFVTSLNVTPFGGLSVGGIVRYYSGYPINETVGSDVNADRDNTDRPIRGIHDLTRPILSEVDSRGVAVRNGIDGNSTTLLDLQFQYVVPMRAEQSIGFFWEIYNALNKVNLGNPTGNRNNRNFMVPVEAGTMRAMQLGVRYTF